MHISVKGLDPKHARAGRAPFYVTADGVTDVSCSGFILGKGQNFEEVLVCCSVAPLLLFLRGEARARLSSATHSDLAPGTEVTGHTASGSSFPLRLLAVAGLPSVREGLQRLLAAASTAGPGGWRLAWGALPSAEVLEAASHVALLRGHLGQGEALPSLLRVASGELALGSPLMAVGAPFGVLSPRHFQGYVVRGNLAACLQGSSPESRRASLLLLDLPGYLPGLEGAAVLDGARQAWVGALLGTMKDPVAQAHYALAAPAATLLEAAANVLGRQTWSLPQLSDGGSSLHSCIDQALPAVVAVSTGGSWATGVIISPAGHVMTNGHLLPALNALATAPGPPVQVQVAGRWVPAEVVHIFQGLDVAVLRLQADPDGGSLEWPAVQLSRNPVLEGQPVSLAGWPAFNPTNRLGPFVSAGYITKVVHLLGSGAPGMVMTSAAVHSGASGGALLDHSTGRLVALATSNTKHSRELLPRLNFSIPASLLRPMFQLANACQELRDPGGTWSALEPDPAPLREVWGLGQAPNRKLGNERPRVPAALAALLDKELPSIKSRL